MFVWVVWKLNNDCHCDPIYFVFYQDNWQYSISQSKQHSKSNISTLKNKQITDIIILSPKTDVSRLKKKWMMRNCKNGSTNLLIKQICKNTRVGYEFKIDSRRRTVSIDILK